MLGFLGESFSKHMCQVLLASALLLPRGSRYSAWDIVYGIWNVEYGI